jgi:hypothetical protein
MYFLKLPMLSDARNRRVLRYQAVNCKQGSKRSSTAGQIGKKLPALPGKLAHYRPDPGMLRGI